MFCFAINWLNKHTICINKVFRGLLHTQLGNIKITLNLFKVHPSLGMDNLSILNINLACQCSSSFCSFSTRSSSKHYFITKKLHYFSIHMSCTTLIMPSRFTSCGVVGKSANFVDVATFFNIEPSCSNFEVHMMHWLCGAKLEGGWGIDFNKLEMLGIASVPLLKLGRGAERRVTTWPKLIAKEFLGIVEPRVEGGIEWIERWFEPGVCCKNSWSLTKLFCLAFFQFSRVCHLLYTRYA